MSFFIICSLTIFDICNIIPGLSLAHLNYKFLRATVQHFTSVQRALGITYGKANNTLQILKYSLNLEGTSVRPNKKNIIPVLAGRSRTEKINKLEVVQVGTSHKIPPELAGKMQFAAHLFGTSPQLIFSFCMKVILRIRDFITHIVSKH